MQIMRAAVNGSAHIVTGGLAFSVKADVLTVLELAHVRYNGKKAMRCQTTMGTVVVASAPTHSV